MKAGFAGLAVAVALGCALQLPAVGQPPAFGPGRRMGGPAARGTQGGGAAQLERIARALNLTEQQRKDIRAVVRDAMERRRDIVGSAKLTPGQKRERLLALRNETRKRIEKVLTPDQRAKAKEILRRRMAAMRRGITPGAPGGPGPKRQAIGRRLAMAARYLGLTPEQKKRLGPILKDAAAKVRGLRQDRSATPEQRRERLADIRENTLKRVREVLNPEQRRKLEELLERRRGT